MKQIQLFFLAVFTLMASAVVAQERTESVKVWGNCSMCKKRIEKAAKLDGVVKADWNADTKLMTVTYDETKTHLDKIQKAVAKVGHDTQKYRAETTVYEKLHACCQYEREVTKEHSGHKH